MGKAYPELQKEARENTALNWYIDQVEEPRVAFSVRQWLCQKLSQLHWSLSPICLEQLNALMERLKKLECELNETTNWYNMRKQYHCEGNWMVED